MQAAVDAVHAVESSVSKAWIRGSSTNRQLKSTRHQTFVSPTDLYIIYINNYNKMIWNCCPAKNNSEWVADCCRKRGTNTPITEQCICLCWVWFALFSGQPIYHTIDLQWFIYIYIRCVCFAMLVKSVLSICSESQMSPPCVFLSIHLVNSSVHTQAWMNRTKTQDTHGYPWIPDASLTVMHWGSHKS